MPRVTVAFLLALVSSMASSGRFAAAATANYTCSLPQTCALFDDTSSGQGIRSEANTGYGIYSTSLSGTGFFASSGSGAFSNPGVAGESTNQTGNDAAATFGIGSYLNGTPPTYGLLSYGSLYGSYGYAANTGASASTESYGVFGQDNVQTSRDFNIGVVGSSSFGTGILAESNGSPTQNYFGIGIPIGLYAVAAPASNNSVAIEAESPSYVIEAHNTKSNEFAELLSPFDMLSLSGPSGSFRVLSNGDAQLSGTLTTSKGTYDRLRGSSGRAVVAYGQRSTVPTLEDLGEGELQNGRASIAIDAKLADVIDSRTGYLVFLTPEGDCNGLYVAQKSATGFVVRELKGGRATLSFAYRIVVKPLGRDGERLAAAPADLVPSASAIVQSRPATRPVTPFDRLRQRLGSAGYAKAIRAAHAGPKAL